MRELGLYRAVEKFCAGFARRSELEIAFKAGPAPEEISSDAEHALFRVCQEALMNVYRHAFARRVSVRLQHADGQLVLEVRDDGIGVDGIDRFEHGGMGVAGMRSRMRGVGGELVLDYLGPGLSVTARVPQPPTGALAAASPVRVAESSRRRRRDANLGQAGEDGQRPGEGGATSAPGFVSHGQRHSPGPSAPDGPASGDRAT